MSSITNKVEMTRTEILGAVDASCYAVAQEVPQVDPSKSKLSTLALYTIHKNGLESIAAQTLMNRSMLLPEIEEVHSILDSCFNKEPPSNEYYVSKSIPKKENIFIRFETSFEVDNLPDVVHPKDTLDNVDRIFDEIYKVAIIQDDIKTNEYLYNYLISRAAALGDIEKVIKLLEIIGPSNINKFRRVLNNALLASAKKGHETILLALLNKGADISLCLNSSKKTNPLYIAIKNGHIAIAKALIDEIKNIDIHNYKAPKYIKEKFILSVIFAAKIGYTEVISSLIDKFEKFNEGFSSLAIRLALYFAAKNGHYETILLLSERYKTLWSFELTAAAKKGHKEIVTYFIDRFQCTSEMLSKALMAAVKNGQNEIVKLIIEKNRKCVLAKHLFQAAENDHLETFQIIFDYVENVNSTHSDDGVSPFHTACMQGRIKVVKAMLNNRRKRTPYRGYVGNSGIHFDMRDDYNYSPLMYAVINEHLDVVEILINMGANINVRISNLTLLEYVKQKEGMQQEKKDQMIEMLEKAIKERSRK